MLNNRNLEDRTYESLMADALMDIPLYSREWTNYNPSDPGITILENLTAFEILQQNHINQITPAIRLKLLKMAGFETEKGRCARVLLAVTGLQTSLDMPANQKFHLGDLCFETNRSLELEPCHLTGVYGMQDGTTCDFSYLLDREVRVPACIFGEKARGGSHLWFTMDHLPAGGEEIIFYMETANRYNRNPFEEKGNNNFASIKWECYTEYGFEEMNVKDFTGCFLTDGEIRLRLPNAGAAVCPHAPDGRYAIRATLVRADYDVTPMLVSVSGFLFEAWQKDTKSACYTFNRVSSASLSVDLLREGYFMVFCKEQKGSSYKRYLPFRQGGQKGRFYEMQVEEKGTHTWFFDKRRFGFGPEKLKNAIKVVVYSEEIMRQYSLGTVLGTDRQKIKLPVESVVPDSFCIIARRKDENGEDIYDFVRPSRYGDRDLTYILLENEGAVMIEDAGDFIGADLYAGTLSVSRGEEGNIRAGNQFVMAGADPAVEFYNPKPGTGGRLRETLDDLQRRFWLDLKKTYRAVTAQDYETLVRETPQLCIQKVRAFLNPDRNMVRIAVKPKTEEEFPHLPETYRKAIERHMEDKRLLCTRIEILGPVYVPIHVRAKVFVKSQYENSREMIEAAVRRKIDYLHSEKNFGDVLYFEEVFHEIESLDCVEFVYELSMHPQNAGLARLEESDIIPAQNCLCYAGEILLETGGR